MAVTFAPRSFVPRSFAPRPHPGTGVVRSSWVAVPSPGVLVDPHGFLDGAGAGTESPAGVRSSGPHPRRPARPAHPAAGQPARAPFVVAAANPVDGRVDGRLDGRVEGRVEGPVDGPVGSPRRVATWAAAGVAVLLAVSGVLGAIGSVSADATPSPRVWVVREGDTLWGIARSLQPRGDVRPLVSQLVQLNGTSAVHAGDSIVVPRTHR